MADTESLAPQRKILVIDDDESCREAVVFALHRNYEVVTACHGEEALSLLRKGLRPTLIFCDLSMPVMDGWAFCEEWDRDPDLVMIPVVLVSGEAQLEGIALGLHVDGWLKKPVDLDDLEAAVERYSRKGPKAA